MTAQAETLEPQAGTRTNAVVWSEIPVRDLEAGCAFYSAVIGAEVVIGQMGPDLTGVLPYAKGQGVSGHLYIGKPAPEGTGSTIHLAVDGPLEETMGRVWAAGGKVLGEPVAIPFGRFFYAADPDGNSIGIFEG